MYLPPRMPDPRSSDFSIAAGREVVEILKRTRGRAFVLFTSYATMRDVLESQRWRSTIRSSRRAPRRAHSC